MGNEENYKDLENVIKNWVNPDGFYKKGLFYQKNTCEPLNHSFLKREQVEICHPDNIFLLTSS
jgi:hypothetical protein